MSAPPPPPPVPVPATFKPGDEVEVTMTSDGGAWYEALVYSINPAGLYLVVHKSLPDAADPSSHLREAVPASQLRPRPPPTKALPLALDQPVEAFYKHGWRAGVVWKLPGRQGVRDYEILFNGGEEKFTCRAKLLRRPLDWVNGAWIVSAAQEKFTISQKLGRAATSASKQSPHASRSTSACDNHTEAKITEELTYESRLLSSPLSKKAKTEETEANKFAEFPESFSKRFDETMPGAMLLSVSGERELVAGTRKKKTLLRKTSIQKERTGDFNPSARGDYVGTHQERILVKMPSVEGHAILKTELSNQGSPIKSMGEHEISNPMMGLLGTSNSQYQHDEAKAELESLMSIPKASSTIPLPFEKLSPMWNYIDMEVMPKMRQCPHFQPLRQVPEAQREGIAIGLMVTYDYLMTEKGWLKMGSTHHFDENMKIILDLEEHGFEVQRLRAHLEGLLRVKSYYDQHLQNSVTQVHTLGRNDGSNHLNAELEESDKKEKINCLNVELETTDRAVMVLKQALDLFHEKRNLLSKHEEESETLTANLQGDLRLAVEELAASVGTFQGILTECMINYC